MLTALLLSTLVSFDPGPRLSDPGARHLRLVSDDGNGWPAEHNEDTRPSLGTPIVFLSIGAFATLTGFVLTYVGLGLGLGGAVGPGMVGTAFAGAGVIFLAIGVVVIIGAVVFAVIGAIKLTRAIRARRSSAKIEDVDTSYAAVPPPSGWVTPGDSIVLATF